MSETKRHLADLISKAEAFRKKQESPDEKKEDPSKPSNGVLSKVIGSLATIIDSDALALPTEHILVHNELKRLAVFCQSGKVDSLGNLMDQFERVEETEGA